MKVKYVITCPVLWGMFKWLFLKKLGGHNYLSLHLITFNTNMAYMLSLNPKADLIYVKAMTVCVHKG